jgi:hypothetical protein
VTDTRRGKPSAASPAAPAVVRTDEDLYVTYRDAYLTTNHGRSVALRAVYDLGRADMDAELAPEIAALVAEARETFAVIGAAQDVRDSRIIALEDELARLRAKAGP